MKGRRTLVGIDLMEAIDLYQWGAHMSDIAMIYDVQKSTVRTNIAMHGVPIRQLGRPASVHLNRKDPGIKSIRPRIPAGVKAVDGLEAPDQLLRSSARALQDKRIAERLADVRIRSYPAEASEYRYAFLRNDSRLPDPE